MVTDSLHAVCTLQFIPDLSAIAILDRKYQLWRESYRRVQTMFPLLTTGI